MLYRNPDIAPEVSAAVKQLAQKVKTPETAGYAEAIGRFTELKAAVDASVEKEKQRQKLAQSMSFDPV
jgi:Na+-transporting methylmalonyl-CoA/oxaloacetate decarboxylase gamma subunit